MRNAENRLTLVLGGARSGKSALAERIVTATGRPRVYLATSQIWDDEMRDRIEQHRVDRGAGWRVIEEPLEIGAALAGVSAEEVVLLDCATLWLSNVMLDGRDAGAEAVRLIAALRDCPAPVVVVSNEVGQGIVPENALARRYRDEHGRLNQRLAAAADAACVVFAGLPMVLKGRLPEGIA